MIPYFSGASRLIKAELFFLDPRLRKDDIPPPVMPDLIGHPGQRILILAGR